nr:integrase, catalytic region, zinc finger, CCHC-type, peptidase aspartic, catalytic [Tanacetum cinerariifolium]
MIPDLDDNWEQIIKPLSKMTEINKKQYIADVRVMNYLLQAIPNDIYNSVDACKIAQSMWEQPKRLMYARAITQKFPIPTNNRLHTSSNTRNQAVIQDGRVDIQTKNTGYGGNGNRNAGRQNRNQMFNAGNGLTHNDEYETLEELTVVVIMMAQIQPADDNAVSETNYDAKAVNEVNVSHKMIPKGVHEHKNHKKCKTVVNTSDDDQIDLNIIFDDPWLGYQNLERLKKAIAAQQKMYHGELLYSTKLKIDSHDSEETLEDAKESQLKMRNKMTLKELQQELIEEVQKMLNIFESVKQIVEEKFPKENIFQNEIDRLLEVIQLVLCIVDSGCSKHMTGNLQLLRNFVEKFIGTVRFGNDHFAVMTGYGDYVQENITICHVYYVEGLEHKPFSVGQFWDGDLEVASRSNTCYVLNLEGVDLLTGSRHLNIYTIFISELADPSRIKLCKRNQGKAFKGLIFRCFLVKNFVLFVTAFCLPDESVVAFFSLCFVRKRTLRFGSCVLVHAFWFLRIVSCDLVTAFWFCDLVMRFAYLKTFVVFAKERLCLTQNFIAFCLQSRLRFATRLVAFFYKNRCVLLQDKLRFASRNVAFCLKTFAFVSRLKLAFCLKILGFVSRFLRFVSRLSCVLSTFEDLLCVLKSINERAQHKREYDNWVNERQMQTTKENVDTSKVLDASLVDKESSKTESKEQDTSSRPVNDAHDDYADIRPIHDEEPMAEGFKEFSTDEQAMTSDHNSSELRLHDHNNEQSSSKLVPNVVLPGDKTYTSRQELEFLFHHHITMLSLELFLQDIQSFELKEKDSVHIILRYDGDECDKGRIPTKIELTLEQSQQGVSNDVLVRIEGVEELKRNVWIIEHLSDTYVFIVKMEILLEPTSNKFLVDRNSTQRVGGAYCKGETSRKDKRGTNPYDCGYKQFSEKERTPKDNERGRNDIPPIQNKSPSIDPLLIREAPHHRSEQITFLIVRSDSPQIMLFRRTAIAELGMIPSTMHFVVLYQSKVGPRVVMFEYQDIKRYEQANRLRESSFEAPLEVSKCVTQKKK